ncbi:MAG: LapA family protein [Aquificaceae bacterium]|nr:LapA family protein [Aquificaceae bacterium]MDW8097331.1 LapA family protein [Aquificaceae bacterium]
MNLLKLLLIVSLLLAFLLFIAQNASYVEISLFYAIYSVPLFVLLLTSFGLGFVLASLYFLLREVALVRRLKLLEGGLREWSRGYPSRAERLLSPLRQEKGVRTLLAELLQEQGRGEEAIQLEPSVAKEKTDYEQAVEGLSRELSQDRENLRALKVMRNLHAVRGEWETALEYQSRILELSERWEKEAQRRIKAEIMAQVYLQRGSEKHIERAVELSATPFVYGLYLKHLLSQEKTKEAKKHWEKICSLNYQEEVLWHLMEEQETLSRLLDLVESRRDSLSADTVAMVYIRLNLLTRAKELEDELSPVVKALLHSAQSHREQDRLCEVAIRSLLRPFICSCGRNYINYRPLCEGCWKWGQVSVRRSAYVS